MSQIEHFAFYTDDTTALKDFYVKNFGLRVLIATDSNPPAYFLGDDRGVAIELIGRPEGNAAVNQRWVCHLAFWTDDFYSKRAELEGLGIVFESDTLVDNDEIKTAFFKDPAGNRSQIIWRKKRLGEGL